MKAKLVRNQIQRFLNGWSLFSNLHISKAIRDFKKQTIPDSVYYQEAVGFSSTNENRYIIFTDICIRKMLLFLVAFFLAYIK